MTLIAELNKTEVFELEKAVSGEIILESERIETAGQVIEKIKKFGGDGWICATDAAEIRPITAGKFEIEPNAWPVCAEAVKGKESISLLREGDSWVLSTMSLKEGSAVILYAEYGTSKGWVLEYEVCWKKIDVDGIKELRPFAYRLSKMKKGA